MKDIQAFPGNRAWADGSGMTLRDWFAGQALSGILADATIIATNVDLSAKVYDMADAMLAERDK